MQLPEINENGEISVSVPGHGEFTAHPAVVADVMEVILVQTGLIFMGDQACSQAFQSGLAHETGEDWSDVTDPIQLAVAAASVLWNKFQSEREQVLEILERAAGDQLMAEILDPTKISNN